MAGMFTELQKLRDQETAAAAPASKPVRRPKAPAGTSTTPAVVKPAGPPPALPIAEVPEPAATPTPPAALRSPQPGDLADHISDQPYMQANFQYTEDELNALDSFKHALRQAHDIRATKNNIVRCALHLLLTDYQERGDTSFVVKQLLKIKR